MAKKYSKQIKQPMKNTLMRPVKMAIIPDVKATSYPMPKMPKETPAKMVPTKQATGAGRQKKTRTPEDSESALVKRLRKDFE